MFLNELAEPQLIVIYPGRFQPFHKGHYAVYEYLVGKFGRQNVWIATSNKTDAVKSPFTFAEKAYFMQLTGVPADRIIQSTQPYQIENVISSGHIQIANPNNTVAIFAVSQKDMDEDPRFSFAPKKDGSQPYFQPLKNIKDTVPMTEHGYIITVPTFDFKVLGQPMRSGTELRQLYANSIGMDRQEIVRELFGTYTKEAEQILNDKIPQTTPDKPTKAPGQAAFKNIKRQLTKEDQESKEQQAIADFEKWYADELSQTKSKEQELEEKWSEKYKKSINCAHPKGFSQRAHCQGRKKTNETLPAKNMDQLYKIKHQLFDPTTDTAEPATEPTPAPTAEPSLQTLTAQRDRIEQLAKLKQKIEALKGKAEQRAGFLPPGLSADLEDYYTLDDVEKHFPEMLASYQRQLKAIEDYMSRRRIVSRESEFEMPGTTIPHKSIIRGWTVFYNPNTRIVSVTKGGESEEAAIDQTQIKTPSIRSFQTAAEQLINKIEAEIGHDVVEGWSDRDRDHYAVYVGGEKKIWQDLNGRPLTDTHARNIMYKMREKYRKQGKDPMRITIAPLDYDKTDEAVAMPPPEAPQAAIVSPAPAAKYMAQKPEAPVAQAGQPAFVNTDINVLQQVAQGTMQHPNIRQADAVKALQWLNAHPGYQDVKPLHPKGTQYDDNASTLHIYKPEQYRNVDEDLSSLMHLASQGSYVWSLFKLFREYGLPIGLFSAAIGVYGLARTIELAQQGKEKFIPVAQDAAKKVDTGTLHNISAKLHNAFEKAIGGMKTHDPISTAQQFVESGGVGVVRGGKDPRYMTATMGDQNDVTGDTLGKEMQAYHLVGVKAPHTRQKRVDANIGKGLKESAREPYQRAIDRYQDSVADHMLTQRDYYKDLAAKESNPKLKQSYEKKAKEYHDKWARTRLMENVGA